MTTTGSYENGLETGPWSETYEDGSKGRGNYADGSRTGEWKTFHPNGAEQDSGAYDRGLRTGPWISRRPDGTLLREARYREGEPERRGGLVRTRRPHLGAPAIRALRGRREGRASRPLAGEGQPERVDVPRGAGLPGRPAGHDGPGLPLLAGEVEDRLESARHLLG